MSTLTLAIDASTYAASVALIRGTEVLREKTVAMRDPRQEHLMPAIVACLEDVSVHALDRLVCGAGPGSFTSLRIAASIAKGLAVAANKPLFAVSSLLLLIAGMQSAPKHGRWLALLDAMRGEAFAQVIEVTSTEISEGSELRVVRESEIEGLARTMRALTAGSGREVDAIPHARGVARLVRHAALDTPVDLAAWEPEYGRLAEAQVRWESVHGRSLDARRG
jgi:tRNA threonylcarbamoyladenosine biosynthesis protein TsaB